MLALLTALAAVHSVRAQVATDNELYAMYCIGVLFQTTEESDQAPPPPASASPGLLEMLKTQRTDTAERLNRFRAYLAARGFLTGSRNDSLAVMQGINNRGRSESQACSNHMTTCASACLAPQSELIGCIDRCQTSSRVCVSTMRCYQNDGLPF
jgi:hypothetical protein